MDRINIAHNHWFLIAQTQETGMLQVAVSEDDAYNQNCKPSTLPLPSSQPITITSTPN